MTLETILFKKEICNKIETKSLKRDVLPALYFSATVPFF